MKSPIRLSATSNLGVYYATLTDSFLASTIENLKKEEMDLTTSLADLKSSLAKARALHTPEGSVMAQQFVSYIDNTTSRVKQIKLWLRLARKESTKRAKREKKRKPQH